jgi:tRNA 2-thiouridine synthesizing protein C
MTTRRILFVIAHPPQRGALPRELLDALLVGAVFDQHISVLFIADGVYQLLDTAHPEGNIARGFGALPTYDVDAVYVDAAALRRRGLSTDGFTLPVHRLTRGGVRDLLARQDVVIAD